MDDLARQQAPAQLLHKSHQPAGGLCGEAGDKAGGDSHAEHRRHRLCAALDGEVLAVQQVQCIGSYVWPVARRGSRLGREVPGGHRSAGATSPHALVLCAYELGVRRVEDLAALNAFVLCIAEILATVPALGWLMWHDLVGIVAHRKGLARRTGLLASAAYFGLEPCAFLSASL